MSHLNDCEKISRRYTGKMDKGKSDEQSASSSEAQAKRESPNLLEDNSGEDLIESRPDSMAEETPNIMIFREVAKISNRVGDMYELPAFGGSGEKCVIVNFDFDICGYTGMPRLEVDTNDPTKGKVILGDGREIEAKIERLSKEDV